MQPTPSSLLPLSLNHVVLIVLLVRQSNSKQLNQIHNTLKLNAVVKMELRSQDGMQHSPVEEWDLLYRGRTL